VSYDVGKAVLSHISFEDREGGRIWLKGLNSGFRIEPFEIKGGHSQVGPTVKDQRRVGVSAEVIMLANKNLPVQICETRAIEIGDVKP